MSLGEVFGYIASVLVFATFYMKTMVPLRLVAIASNVAFIIYASVGGLTPILILHIMLLPLNAVRLLQIRAFSRQIAQAAREDFSVEALLPLMRRREIAVNDTLFRAGESADELFYVVDGVLFLPELQREVGPGSFLGEFGLFADSGRRTATAIARTDIVLMSLTRNAVFAALLQHPRLGIHLLKLITARFLQNAGQEQPGLSIVEPAPSSAATRPASTMVRRRNRWLVHLAVIGAAATVIAVAVAYHPLYSLIYRDAVVTSWLHVVAAPIDGTVEDLDTRPGQRVGAGGDAGRIVNHSVDRGSVIRAEAAARQAAARLAELQAYEQRISALSSEWTARKERYAEGFRRDLDLKIDDLQNRIALLKERVDIADTTARRKRTLRSSGNASQSDEEAATSEQRSLQSSLTQTSMDLERVRNRRGLAERGIYLQDDGKEPEWSWRSLDEIRLEVARTQRAAREAAETVSTLEATLEGERKNVAAASEAHFVVPAGMTMWSAAATNGISVTRGQRLFTWIDCSVLLVDVPVTETLAVLAQPGMRAEVALQGEARPREGSVLLSRGSSSTLSSDELASITGWRKSDAQVIVALKEPAAVTGCPIGRRAFVRFPDVSLIGYILAWLPAL